MADVYKKAKMGVSWLGEKSDDSSLAFRMIQRWASFLTDPQSEGCPCAFLEDKLQDEIFMPRSVTALKNMLQRPYWKRVWIQQEVALPPIVTIVVGDFGRTMLHFLQYDEQECWRSSDLDLMPTVVETVPLIQLDFYRMSESVDYERDETPNLLHYLYLSIILESTDPRDRIYALLGLPHFEKYQSVFRPSYTKSTSQVFSEAARIMIEEEKSLVPIAVACRLYCTDISLPSWVPDWAALRDRSVPLNRLGGEFLIL
ncbi:hypothetical protein EAF00_005061 [Botryotinia globosa]|nr:hypothetical protein EAF00_005061 [Botryotinia globosa]